MAVIGLGNALVDVLMKLESDDTLQDIGIVKGAMEMINEEQMIIIQKQQEHLEKSVVPGGSNCNTMRALGRLGLKSGYIGKTGTDYYSEFYENEIRQAAVKPYLQKQPGISGISTILISPDGERTMATFLGPAPTVSPDFITLDMLQGYDLIYIEGYLLVNEVLVRSVLEKARKAGLKIVLDLANFNIVNGFKGFLEEIIPEYIDILLSNESEAEAFTGLHPDQAIELISPMVDIAVITLGKKGAMIASGDERVRVPATGGMPVDTTGAGDNFGAGFLYGYSVGAGLEKSGRIGSLLAGYVIEEIGPQIPVGHWGQIKLKVEELLGE